MRTICDTRSSIITRLLIYWIKSTSIHHMLYLSKDMQDAGDLGRLSVMLYHHHHHVTYYHCQNGDLKLVSCHHVV